LKSAELCELRLNFRSDSLVSLMYQNPSPDFSANAGVGLRCRPRHLLRQQLEQLAKLPAVRFSNTSPPH
jgi:hypothetical protein